MSIETYIQIKAGLQNFFGSYSSTILPTKSSITRLTTHKKGYWQVTADFEIIISAKNLSRDNVDPQLGNMEREIMRMIHLYRPNDIPLIESMFYGGHDRLYSSEDWSRSNWMSKFNLRITYYDNQ